MHLPKRVCGAAVDHSQQSARALVYVDDYEIGVTPVSTSFIYYGTRKIRLVKDGYETLTVMQSIPSPWYEYVPLDFVSENFVPGQIRDQRVLDFQLKPQMLVPTDQLLQRAEQLRRGVHPAQRGRAGRGWRRSAGRRAAWAGRDGSGAAGHGSVAAGHRRAAAASVADGPLRPPSATLTDNPSAAGGKWTSATRPYVPCSDCSRE